MLNPAKRRQTALPPWTAVSPSIWPVSCYCTSKDIILGYSFSRFWVSLLLYWTLEWICYWNRVFFHHVLQDSWLKAAKPVIHVCLVWAAVKGTCVTVPYLWDPVWSSCWFLHPSSHSFSELLKQQKIRILCVCGGGVSYLIYRLIWQITFGK